jgi:hypothetical protein
MEAGLEAKRRAEAEESLAKLFQLERDQAGGIVLPDVTCRTLYLWGKIGSPLAEAGSRQQPITPADLEAMDPAEREALPTEVLAALERGESVAPPRDVRITNDQLLEALYVLIKQDDPRVLDLVMDRNRLAEAVFRLTGDLSLADLARIGQELTTKMVALNQALKAEGFGRGKGEGAGSTGSGSTT